MRMKDKSICFKVFKELSLPSMEEQFFANESNENNKNDDDEEEVLPKYISPFVIVEKVRDDDGRIAKMYLRCVPHKFQEEEPRKKKEFDIIKFMVLEMIRESR